MLALEVPSGPRLFLGSCSVIVLPSSRARGLRIQRYD